jgi:Holliday junction resolvasome RuvABC DNA-binding subunit
MIVSNQGMGDILAPDDSATGDYTSLVTLGVAALVIIYLLKGKGSAPSSSSRKKTSRVASSTLSSIDSEVVEGLVSQGATKSQAKLAVSKAKQKGASGFNEIFKQALREL